MSAGLRRLGRRFRSELTFYRLVAGHPRTPWLARALLLAAIAYAFMPFDLVPDWIPVLGHVDDVLVVPLLVWLGVRLVPQEVIAECRRRAAAPQEAGG
ncbi:MAG: YkvA family protein [Candidatus Latescibacterota bacterium]